MKAEISRKIIHIAMGLFALSLPFWVLSRATVVIMGVIATAVLLALRHVKQLRNGIGKAMFGVERKSYGELYFAFSVVVIFMLHQSTYEYLIPILVLTFADSVAALIGTSYGRLNMAQKQEDAKSFEGSVMFYIVAFTCALVPLQLMTEIGRAEVLVISFLIGLLAAMIEAVSANGNDNLLLPLLTYSFVRENAYLSLDTLFINFGIMLFFLLVILVVYKLKNISKLSIAYSMLVGYIVMIQGGLEWILPPLILILSYGILPLMKSEEKQMKLSYKVIECNTIIGMTCLWIAVFFPQYREILYLAFSFSFACHLAINTYSRFVNFVGTKRVTAIICGLLKGIVFIGLPTALIARPDRMIVALYLIFLAAAMLPAVALNDKYDYKTVNDKSIRANKILVGVLTAVFAILGGAFLWYT